jgi:hypothetical protein
MKLHEFESASTKEVKSVSLDSAEQFQKLKNIMAEAQSVRHWNELREYAKDIFPIQVINRLDQSGYINIILPQNTNKV